MKEKIQGMEEERRKILVRKSIKRQRRRLANKKRGNQMLCAVTEEKMHYTGPI
jgi:hypothetical protein